jgi:uncharacterized cupin superfamily protein
MSSAAPQATRAPRTSWSTPADTELRYLAVSTQIDPEVCEYPDSGKIGAYCGDDDQGLVHLSRSADRVIYWDGE